MTTLSATTASAALGAAACASVLAGVVPLPGRSSARCLGAAGASLLLPPGRGTALLAWTGSGAAWVAGPGAAALASAELSTRAKEDGSAAFGTCAAVARP
jgi:hypothetical protein